MTTESPVFYNRNREKWQYSYKGKNSPLFDSKQKCAMEYVNNLVAKEPKYKPMFEGKNWPEIFRVVGIEI